MTVADVDKGSDSEHDSENNEVVCELYDTSSRQSGLTFKTQKTQKAKTKKLQPFDATPKNNRKMAGSTLEPGGIKFGKMQNSSKNVARFSAMQAPG